MDIAIVWLCLDVSRLNHTSCALDFMCECDCRTCSHWVSVECIYVAEGAATAQNDIQTIAMNDKLCDGE